MAKSRLELHETLCDILGSRNVYFQPPSTLTMKYPCIVYSLSDMDNVNADNVLYLKHKRYSIIAISKDPDSELPDKVAELPYCDLNRFYTADNLNHWVFSMYI